MKKLPSQRALREYTNFTKIAQSFNTDVDKQMSKIGHRSWQRKYVIILMDEMHIKVGIKCD